MGVDATGCVWSLRVVKQHVVKMIDKVRVQAPGKLRGLSGLKTLLNVSFVVNQSLYEAKLIISCSCLWELHTYETKNFCHFANCKAVNTKMNALIFRMWPGESICHIRPSMLQKETNPFTHNVGTILHTGPDYTLPQYCVNTEISISAHPMLCKRGN